MLSCQPSPTNPSIYMTLYVISPVEEITSGLTYDKFIRFLASIDFHNQHPLFTLTTNNLLLLHAAYENGL